MSKDSLFMEYRHHVSDVRLYVPPVAFGHVSRFAAERLGWLACPGKALNYVGIATND